MSEYYYMSLEHVLLIAVALNLLDFIIFIDDSLKARKNIMLFQKLLRENS